jgi:hypothetical protein
MAERVRVWEITSKEGNRLLRIVRRSTGPVVTWRRAQMVLLSAQGMLDGSDALYPRYRGGRPPIFTLAQRRRCPAWRPRGGRLRR